MPTSPPDGIINVDRVGQFRHGLIGFLGEPGPSQHVDYFLPGVLHEDNLLTRKGYACLLLRGYAPLLSRRKAKGAPGRRAASI